MIVECGKVLIDTTANHEEHKKAIGDYFLSCRKDEPVYVFTQDVDNEHRYYHLTYNEDGSKLLMIDYYETLKDHEKPRKLEKRLKAKKSESLCYFTKNKVFEEDEYEMVEVIDYSKNTTSKNDTIVWDHNWNDSVVAQKMSGLQESRHSKWVFWK